MKPNSRSDFSNLSSDLDLSANSVSRMKSKICFLKRGGNATEKVYQSAGPPEIFPLTLVIVEDRGDLRMVTISGGTASLLSLGLLLVGVNSP